MKAFYNDADPHACEWVRNLIAAGLVTPGVVDCRPIQEVKADDVRGFTRVHFFAGIGGWDYALALAGWDAARPVWTGSCPCQPFSQAGRGEGEEDPRHLWPAFFSLIRQCRPDCVFGEQVGSPAGYDWLDGVRADLEAEGYAFGAADLPAACVGAPHARQRLFWVAHAGGRGIRVEGSPGTAGTTPAVPGADGQRQRFRSDAGATGRAARRLADADGRDGGDGDEQRGGEHGQQPADGLTGRVDDTTGERALDRRQAEPGSDGADDGVPGEAGLAGGLGNAHGGGQTAQRRVPGGAGADGEGGANHWSDYVLLPCRDGRVRRSQPGLQPVVDGVPFLLADGRTVEGASRAKLLRGIGNAIVPQVAALFIRAFLEATTP